MSIRSYFYPYHPEYNAKEIVWAKIKHHAGHNPAYNLKTLLETTLPNAFLSVNNQTVSDIVANIVRRWRQDYLTDVDPEEIEPKIQENEEDL